MTPQEQAALTQRYRKIVRMESDDARQNFYRRMDDAMRRADRADSDRVKLLVEITTPDFVAGITVINDICEAAPEALSWTIGKPRSFLSEDFRRRGWIARIVEAFDGSVSC